jgi:hypothetical protein
MAIQLKKELESGIICWYHKILRARVDFGQVTADIEIASYTTEEARREGKRPVMIFMHTIEGEAVLSGDIRQMAYAVLASEGQEYEGAVMI